MPEVVGVGVLGELGGHRPQHRQFVGVLPDQWEQVAHGEPAFAVVLELPRRLQHIPHIVELRGGDLHLDLLAVLALQPGLGVERVNLARPPIHEQKDDILGPGGLHGLAGGQRSTRFRGVQAVEPRVTQQGGEGDPAQPVRSSPQHLPPGDRPRLKSAAMHLTVSTSPSPGKEGSGPVSIACRSAWPAGGVTQRPSVMPPLCIDLFPV